jgi:DNA-binding IclR family transcriptional regulator
MSLALLDSQQTADGIAVTFITDHGLERLEGSCEQVARLAEVMQQVSVLATLNDDESVWVEEVTVGDAKVKLGLNPGKQTRMLIVRD